MSEVTVIRSGDHVTITDERVIVKVYSTDLASLLTSLGSEEATDIAGALLSTLGLTAHDLPGEATLVKGGHRDKRFPDGLASVQIDTALGLSGLFTVQTHEDATSAVVSVGEAIAFIIDADYQAIGRAVEADQR